MSIFDRFKLLNLKLAGGEETHRFEAVLAMIRSDGSLHKLAHASNDGRGGSNMYYPIEPITNEWLYHKLHPVVQKGLVEFYQKNPDKCQALSQQETISLLQHSKECIDWLVTDLINQHYEEKQKRKQEREASSGKNLGGFKYGDQVYMMKSAKTPDDKVLSKVIKVNRKTLLVETLEADGKFPPGSRFKGSPRLCVPAPTAKPQLIHKVGRGNHTVVYEHQGHTLHIKFTPVKGKSPYFEGANLLFDLRGFVPENMFDVLDSNGKKLEAKV